MPLVGIQRPAAVSLPVLSLRKGKGRGKGAEDFAGRGGGISLHRVAWLRSWKTAWPRRRREQRGRGPSWTCRSRFCCTSSASSPTRGRGTALRWRATGSSRQSARRGRRCRYAGTRARWCSSSSRQGSVAREAEVELSERRERRQDVLRRAVEL
jgi:hypothetical protein